MTFESSCFKTLLVVLLLSELRKIGLVFFLKDAILFMISFVLVISINYYEQYLGFTVKYTVLYQSCPY